MTTLRSLTKDRDAHPRPAEVLLAEDDDELADVLVPRLALVGRVTRASSTDGAATLAATRRWDLVVAGIEPPTLRRIELVATIRAARPEVATLIVSGRDRVDYAAAAIRAGADDYVTMPVDPPALVGKAVELIALTRERVTRGHEVVLAIGAHPDDVEVGCGGILLRHVAAGHDVAILTLTGGEIGGVPSERALQAGRAAEMLSARLFMCDLHDTVVAKAGPTVAAIERVIDEIAATRIYTHSACDRDQDHRNVNRATLAAARDVPRVYCYQAPSSSADFRPTRFVAIDEFIDRKLEVVRAHRSGVASRPYLDDDLLRATARYWSRFAQSRYAEPLEVVRDREGNQAAGERPAARRESEAAIAAAR